MVNFFFSPEEKQEETFFSPSEAVTPELSEETKNVLSQYYSTASGRAIEDVEKDMNSGLFPVLRAELNGAANISSRESAETKVQGMVAEEATLEEIKAAAEGLIFEDHVAPDIGMFMADKEGYASQEKRILERAIAAERIVAEKVNSAPDGFWAGLGNFADAAISETAHNILGTVFDNDTFEGADDLAELAREASNLILMDIPAEDFERRFSDILDRVNDMGFFTEENPFLLGNFLEMVKESGVGMNTAVNQGFQIFDAVTFGTAGAAKSALKASTLGAARLPRTMTKVASADAAVEAVVRTADKAVDSPILTDGTAASIITQRKDYYSSPTLQARRDTEADNAFLAAFNKFNWGTFVDPEIIAAKKEGWIKDFRAKNKEYKTHELDYDVRTDPHGNIFGVAVLGKRGSEPYKLENRAKVFADSVGGEVLPIMYEGSQRFIVVKEWTIPTAGLADATDVKQVATGFLSNIMSTTARTTVKLDSILKQGEAQGAKVLKNLGKAYRTSTRKVGKEEYQKVDNILRELRDDPEFNWRTTAYTEDEFATRYSQKYGTEPSQDVIDHYSNIIAINDVDWAVNADIALKEAINNKEVMVRLDGEEFRARTSTPDADDVVYDADTGRTHLYSDLDPERVVVYEIKDAEYNPNEAGRVLYVTGDITTRRLYHSDVLPYNIGGHRKYTDIIDFYIKQDGVDIPILGGKNLPARPKTFMGVRTEDEARLVVKQWNTIAEAVRTGAKNIDNIVMQNTGWHLGIEDLTDLKVFADEHGLDVAKNIDYAPDSASVKGQGFAGEASIGDAFRTKRNIAKKRGVQPLVGYGGDNLTTLDPTNSIERGFAQSVSRRSDMNYLFQAINGWIRAADESGAIANASAVAGMSPKHKMMNADISNLTEVGKALIRERETIQYRLSNTTSQIQSEQRFMKSFANWLYKQDQAKLAKAADWMSTKDPAGFIRSIAFHSKLGLFAVEHIYVQASQLVNVIGITQNNIGTIGAIRGALGAFPLRLALVEQIPEPALKRLATIQSAFTGITPEDFIALRDWIKSTGRNIVDRTIVEENNSAAYIHSNKLLDYGQTFFNEGELLARLSAAATNLLERRAKTANEDLFDPRVTREMLHRQDVLTASMTSASAAPWQRSLLSVPLQFTTYHVRMVEQIFTDKILTPKERAKLILTHMFAWGSAGVPAAGYLQDRMGYEGTIDPSTGVYDVVRYGAVDAIFSQLTGEETALASRLAAGEGLFDLFLSTSEDTLMEKAIGPGGQIGLESTKAFVHMIKNVFKGEFNHLEYDWHRFARNITSYNRAYTYFIAQRYGTYITRKTEEEVLSDLSGVDSVLLSLGIPIKEQDAVWTTIGNTMLDDKLLNTHIKEIRRLDRIASRMVKDGDLDGASEMVSDIGAMLAILSPAEHSKVMRRLRGNMTIHENVMANLIKRGKSEYATKLLELTE